MESVDQAFAWRTVFNELKSLKHLIPVIESESLETMMQVETHLADKLSILPDATQQRLKDLAYVSAGICPLYMSQNTFVELKQDILFSSMSGQDLYDTVSRQIHDPLQKFKWLKLAAEKGCTEAQAFVGWCYSDGKCGCVENRLQSVYWYTKATKQNNIEAEHALKILLVDLNVPPTEKDAENRFRTALKEYSEIKEQCDALVKANLEFILGNCYFWAYGTPMDKKQALDFYTLAANANIANAQMFLFEVYHVQKDEKGIEISTKWLHDLAEQGNSNAQILLGHFIVNESEKWNLMASKKENALAMHRLACKYLQNDNIKEAFELFVKSAAKGNLDSSFYLGRYVNKPVTNQIWNTMFSQQEQIKWLTYSADRGHGDAQVELALYLENQGKTKEAFELYVKAANRGNPFAYNCLAICYVEAMCVKRDMIQAVELFTLAANQGNAASQYSLGIRYYNGFENNTFAIDEEKGLMWIQKAANLGFTKAINWLAS